MTRDERLTRAAAALRAASRLCGTAVAMARDVARLKYAAGGNSGSRAEADEIEALDTSWLGAQTQLERCAMACEEVQPERKNSAGILPCAFCGGDHAQFQVVGGDQVWIKCPCGASVHAFNPDATQKATDKWNRRDG